NPKVVGSNPAPATKYQERLLERVAFFVSGEKSPTLQRFCNYFPPRGLVTWLDTPILSRIAQEVIDARPLV
ncbi:hypothetical protein, partial [Pseudomonas brassicacearum]|uniref:hypothetical protein n=1 Tax=Pseudomonas brassicacearum TaxID=930166 RepID=UPI003F5057B2